MKPYPIDYKAMYSILARRVSVAAQEIPNIYLELGSAIELIEEVEKLQLTVIDENWKETNS